MTHLRQIMIAELRCRNFAESTVQSYVRAVEQFSRYFHCPPHRLGSAHVRQYQAMLFTHRKLASSTVTQHLAALRFLYVKVLSAAGDNVNVKIPLSLVRAGLKLTSLIPAPAMEQINKSMAEHGIAMDFSNMKSEDVEDLITALREMEINVDAKNGDNIRVYCA